jgi:hypothetical protein
MAGRQETMAVANSDLCRGEVEHGPGKGIDEMGNHCVFPVHKAPAKLTVAETTVEAQRGRRNNGAIEGAALRAE